MRRYFGLTDYQSPSLLARLVALALAVGAGLAAESLGAPGVVQLAVTFIVMMGVLVPASRTRHHPPASDMTTVEVAELRQNLSRYLRHVAAGERLVVTEHNRPVAELGPPPSPEEAQDRLIAEGRVSRPRRQALPDR